MSITVRPPVIDDAEAMATVHVETWRETYRGLMPDELLDSPDMLASRRELWRTHLTEQNRQEFVSAVADQGGELVGIAMSGPSREEGQTGDRHLFVLYTYAAVQGSGAGQALLDAVMDPAVRTTLWVADPNPRAQAFYRRNGFVADGAVETDEYDGVREIRMVREPSPDPGHSQTTEF